MKPCKHCNEHSDYCETPCHHYNAMFEKYLVIAYAMEKLEVSLESKSEWRKRCQELNNNLQYVTHYLRSLIQPQRLACNQGPDLGSAGWPLWVKDRAEVAIKRFVRSRAS